MTDLGEIGVLEIRFHGKFQLNRNACHRTSIQEQRLAVGTLQSDSKQLRHRDRDVALVDLADRTLARYAGPGGDQACAHRGVLGE
jgi:hypothetical protein